MGFVTSHFNKIIGGISIAGAVGDWVTGIPLMCSGTASAIAAYWQDQRAARQPQAVEVQSLASEAAAEIAHVLYPRYAALQPGQKVEFVQALAQADPEALVSAPEVQQALASITDPGARALATSCVRSLPAHVRRTQRSHQDPSGRTATIQSVPQSLAGLQEMFAPVPSIYHPGQPVPHMHTWTLTELLGSGGSGEVWRASKQGHEDCAVKFTRGQGTPEQLRQERDLVAKLQLLTRHDPQFGIVPIDDSFLDPAHPPHLLCLEYVPGMTLEDLIQDRQRQGRLISWQEMQEHWHALVLTMARCHDRGVYHRDLKPANILCDTRRPDAALLRITDFGNGAALDAQTGRLLPGSTGSLSVGTFRYASPEQKAGRRGCAQDDVYALGMIALDLLSTAFKISSIDGKRWSRLLAEGCPESLLDLVSECIADEQADRPADAAELLQRLPGVSVGVKPLGAQGASATPPPLPVRVVLDSIEAFTPATANPQKLSALKEVLSPQWKLSEDYARELSALSYVEVGRFRFGQDYQRDTQLFPLPQRISWEALAPSTSRPSQGLSLRIPGDPASAIRLAKALHDAGEHALLARLSAVGNSFTMADFSLMVQGSPVLLLDPGAEARAALKRRRVAAQAVTQRVRIAVAASKDQASSLQAISELMVPIIAPGERGSIKPADGQEIVLTQPYSICSVPVTQAWHQAIMGSNPSHFKGKPTYPVENVSWEDAQAFIRKLNALSVKSGFRYQLPTELQWEYACRAGGTGQWGRLITGQPGSLRNMGWFNGNSGNTTHPVAELQPNAFGLYDMHGNVWEWCQDGYADYSTPLPLDYKSAAKGSIRGVRGGGWGCDPGSCHAADRLYYQPNARSSNIGFRLASVPLERLKRAEGSGNENRSGANQTTDTNS